MSKEIKSVGAVFPKKVRWEFKFATHGYGRTCKEALLYAFEKEIERLESREYGIADLLAIENHECISIDENEELEE